ncbi:MAG: YaaR family protein [Lachnospiraceae bacterium]|nr:YaaR family protein [Lachnospiraceae bacterium]
MDTNLKLDAISQLTRMESTEAVKNAGGEDFKFTLVSHIEESELAQKLEGLMKEIEQEGQRIAKHKDIRDMKRYRAKIKEFMNEVTSRSYAFSRENFLDRKGRHRVYGIIRKVDENLDQLAEELMKEEKDHLEILRLIGDIKGMLIDIVT